MHNSFFLSDPHFGHKNIITFKDDDGNLIRPFSTIEEMDELIIKNWNNVVRNVDRIYCLGDIVMNRRALPIIKRLNGKICLIKGNHDIFKLKDYLPYFDDIRAYKMYPKHGIVFSHIPVHPRQLQGIWKANCHGHLHKNLIDDKRYINLCCEHINYTPVSLDQVIEIMKERNNETK